MKILLPVVAVLVIVGIVAVILFGWYMSNYNLVVKKDQAVKQAWGDVDAQLKRRYDLIPNLVATVKGYAAHESRVFEDVAQARAAYSGARTPAEQIAASGQVEGALGRLLAIVENYPNLKANENFLSLQDQLEGTENRIAVARTRYNQAVNDLNTYARSFFGGFFARRAGVAEAKYYEVPPAETAAPTVSFESTAA